MGKGKKLSSEEGKQESNGLIKKNNGKDQNGDVHKEATEDDDYITPPDGGWGWMVVFSSFLIHVIADGIVYSFGVFLMEFVDYFKSGRGATSWVGSLQPAVTFTVGPLSSALTNRYGCRRVTIIGAIIASAGFVLSVFAPNLYYLYFTSGIMAGSYNVVVVDCDVFCLEMVVVVAVVMMNDHGGGGGSDGRWK